MLKFRFYAKIMLFIHNQQSSKEFFISISFFSLQKRNFAKQSIQIQRIVISQPQIEQMHTDSFCHAEPFLLGDSQKKEKRENSFLPTSALSALQKFFILHFSFFI